MRPGARRDQAGKSDAQGEPPEANAGGDVGGMSLSAAGKAQGPTDGGGDAAAATAPEEGFLTLSIVRVLFYHHVT